LLDTDFYVAQGRSKFLSSSCDLKHQRLIPNTKS